MLVFYSQLLEMWPDAETQMCFQSASWVALHCFHHNHREPWVELLSELACVLRRARSRASHSQLACCFSSDSWHWDDDVIVEHACHLGRLTQSVGSISPTHISPHLTDDMRSPAGESKVRGATESSVSVRKRSSYPVTGGHQTSGQSGNDSSDQKTVRLKTALPIMHQRPECVGACCFPNTHSDISLGF